MGPPANEKNADLDVSEDFKIFNFWDPLHTQMIKLLLFYLWFDKSNDEGEYVEEASLPDALWASGSHSHL